LASDPAVTALPTNTLDAARRGRTALTALAPVTTVGTLATRAVYPGARAPLHAGPTGSPGTANTRASARAACGPTGAAGAPRTRAGTRVGHASATLTALAAGPTGTVSTWLTRHRRARTARTARTASPTGAPGGIGGGADTAHPARTTLTADPAITEQQPPTTTDPAGASRGTRRARGPSSTRPAGTAMTPVAEQPGSPTRTAISGRRRGSAGHPRPAITAITPQNPTRPTGLPSARRPVGTVADHGTPQQRLSGRINRSQHALLRGLHC
jgi:hypothetical protein